MGGPQSRWHSIGDSWNPRRALLGQLCWAVAAGVTLECPGARLHGPADPRGERSHVERRPGDERAHALSRKSACSGRETRAGAAGVRSSTSGKRSHYRSWRCKTRNPRSAGDPGKLKPFLTPTSSFTSCRRQVSIGTRRTRHRRSCAKRHRIPRDQAANHRYGPSQAPVTFQGTRRSPWPLAA